MRLNHTSPLSTVTVTQETLEKRTDDEIGLWGPKGWVSESSNRKMVVGQEKGIL